MPNLYTFGCSYTSYKYPTYANYIAPYFNKHINLGKPGAGNRLIYNKIVREIIDNNIKEDDLVLIQWSSLLREDRIYGEDWSAGGIISNTLHYDDEWVEKYFNPKQQATELLSYLTTLLPLLKTKTKNVRWFYMFEPWIGQLMGEPVQIPKILSDKYHLLGETNLLDEIKKISDDDDCYLESIESYLIDNKLRGGLIYVYDSFSNQVNPDDHPSPLDHYHYSLKIKKSLNMEIFNNDLIDIFLKKNSLKWGEYSTNKEKVEICEFNTIKNTGDSIKYEKINGTMQWPTIIKQLI